MTSVLNPELKKWLRLSLLNLLIVAFAGIIQRYKIAFPLPFIDQRNLMHAHSHLAFAGWITQALMALMVNYLYNNSMPGAFGKYKWILWANLISAWGMFVTFANGGFDFLSHTFSGLNVIVFYIFAVMYWIDLGRMKEKNIIHHWFKAALVFSCFSYLGGLALGVMLATKVMHQMWFLGAVYFFMHFQYNGWFFFALMGLLMEKFLLKSINPNSLKIIFIMFAIACVPTYFLSALWIPVPRWTYWLMVLSAAAQLIGWIWIVNIIRKNISELTQNMSSLGKWLIILPLFALLVKFLLQFSATHPALTRIAYEFHSIVIGFLHLVFLAITSLFILGYIVNNHLLNISKAAARGIIIFTLGIIINELILMSQGIAALFFKTIPGSNVYLLGAAVIMFSGVLLINLSQKTSIIKSPAN
ncbi:MAG TPA: hypothetical protein VI461_08290 [Chitinophagaceae bacterium]|nr:hypothetical protein [Chitinophagaceae bacterium]